MSSADLILALFGDCVYRNNLRDLLYILCRGGVNRIAVQNAYAVPKSVPEEAAKYAQHRSDLYTFSHKDSFCSSLPLGIKYNSNSAPRVTMYNFLQ